VDVALDEPPEDPEDWTEEQWLEYLAVAPQDPETGRAHPLSRTASRAGHGVLAAAMFGLERAIYGEVQKAEIVVEADTDGLDLPDGVLDVDDPSASWLVLPEDG
jgi:hypothetical protein